MQVNCQLLSPTVYPKIGGFVKGWRRRMETRVEKLTHLAVLRVAITPHGPFPRRSSSASCSRSYKPLAPFLPGGAADEQLDARPPPAGSVVPEMSRKDRSAVCAHMWCHVSTARGRFPIEDSAGADARPKPTEGTAFQSTRWERFPGSRAVCHHGSFPCGATSHKAEGGRRWRSQRCVH